MNTLITRAARAIEQADALLIGASNGLSIAEGYHIFANNEMFRRKFGDFQQKYGIRCVLEGCYYDYPDANDRREFLRRLLQYWVNDYRPTAVMQDLRALMADKDYFVLTTNADTHLELSGFSPDRVFEIEGTFEDLAQSRSPRDKSQAVGAFLARYHGRRLVVVELGIGKHNRLIKLPLMQLVAQEPQATYITLNLETELYIPDEIAPRSIGLAGDIAITLRELKEALV